MDGFDKTLAERERTWLDACVESFWAVQRRARLANYAGVAILNEMARNGPNSHITLQAAGRQIGLDYDEVMSVAEQSCMFGPEYSSHSVQQILFVEGFGTRMPQFDKHYRLYDLYELVLATMSPPKQTEQVSDGNEPSAIEQRGIEQVTKPNESLSGSDR